MTNFFVIEYKKEAHDLRDYNNNKMLIVLRENAEYKFVDTAWSQVYKSRISDGHLFSLCSQVKVVIINIIYFSFIVLRALWCLPLDSLSSQKGNK